MKHEKNAAIVGNIINKQKNDYNKETTNQAKKFKRVYIERDLPYESSIDLKVKHKEQPRLISFEEMVALVRASESNNE